MTSGSGSRGSGLAGAESGRCSGSGRESEGVKSEGVREWWLYLHNRLDVCIVDCQRGHRTAGVYYSSAFDARGYGGKRLETACHVFGKC